MSHRHISAGGLRFRHWTGLVLIAAICGGSAGPAHARAARKTKPKPAAAGTAPVDPDAKAILRPVFTVDGKPLDAGTAFVVRLGAGPLLLVTAHHLFGPWGGYERDLGWEELGKHVSAVHARSLAGGAVVSGQQPLRIEGAMTSNGNPAGRDVAAFRIADAGGATVFELAAQAPKKGDRVFLLAQVGSDRLLRHAATVGDVGPMHVAYRYDDAGIELRATSGAPVLDAENHVVAINLGGGAQGGRLWGYGNPVHAFRPKLEQAANGK